MCPCSLLAPVRRALARLHECWSKQCLPGATIAFFYAPKPDIIYLPTNPKLTSAQRLVLIALRITYRGQISCFESSIPGILDLPTNPQKMILCCTAIIYHSVPQVKGQFRIPGGVSEGGEMWPEGSPMTEAMDGMPGADAGGGDAIPVLMFRLKAGCKVLPLVLVLVFVCSCVEEIAKRR